MLLIPVIDLGQSNVVHAIAGKRDSYRNIETPLCRGSSPLAIVSALLDLHAFSVIYVADLDAIKESGNNARIIGQILAEFPQLSLWLDSGKDFYSGEYAHARIRQVLGSETGLAAEDINAKEDDILSLDFIGDKLLGDKRLLENVEAWPRDVIVMSLSHVGTGNGPDFKRLENTRSLATDRHIYAAGGVRNEKDLARLENIGVAGVLLASALHDGSISKSVLEHYPSP